MGMTVEEFLSHHGVKGMKWGVRKRRGSSKATGSESSPHKPAHELSDEELKNAVARMNMEQQYKKLLNPKPPKKDSEAAAFVKQLGKNLVSTAVSAAGTAAINKAIKK